jgi:hypothetical protein
MKLRFSFLLAPFLALLTSCASSSSPPLSDEDDPAAAATIQQADDESPPEDTKSTADDETEADSEIACTRCGPGPQPWHSGAVKVRHHRHDE